MKKTIKTLMFIFCMTICISFCLTACGEKCEHTYDNACDATCNECGEARDQQAHQWIDATCTSLKTCTDCGYTEGEMLPHNWEDATCITPDLCSCGYTVTVAKNHVAGEDDGNCTTPIGCVNCEKDAKAGATGHNDFDHDYVCDNAGCHVTVGNPPKDNN